MESLSLPLFTLSKSYIDWTTRWVQQCLTDPNFPTPSAKQHHREVLMKIITSYVFFSIFYETNNELHLVNVQVVRILEIISKHSHRHVVKLYQRKILHDNCFQFKVF
jgi:hypothetical protein